MSDASEIGTKPLTGRKILVMRAIHQAGKLSEGLAVLGAEPVEVPVLEIRPPDSLEPLDSALKKIDSFDWLLLTSVNTVHAVAARCTELNIDVSSLKGLRVAAVGGATAEAARRAGFRVTIMPEHYSSEGMVSALKESGTVNRVLLARAKVARNVIPEALTAAGAILTVVDAYQTVLPIGAKDRLVEALRVGIDIATFTSSSSVRNLAEVAREVGIEYPLVGVPAVSIGPVTSATLREFGWEPAAEAEVSDLPGLIAAIVKRQALGNIE